MRTFKRTLVESVTKILNTCHSETFKQISRDFVFKTGKGRIKAFEQARKMMQPARLLMHSTDNPMACFGWLAPSGQIIDDEHPSYAQDCTVVQYYLIGRLSRNHTRATSGHTIECPDHALGRLLQRAPKADPTAALWEAQWLMKSSMKELIDCIERHRVFFLPAGDAVFLCEGIFLNDGPDRKFARRPLYARARTWLTKDMLRPYQQPITLATGDDYPMALSVFTRLYDDQQ